MPWGGYKQSGIGYERGQEGLDSYTQVSMQHNFAPGSIVNMQSWLNDSSRLLLPMMRQWGCCHPERG